MADKSECSKCGATWVLRVPGVVGNCPACGGPAKSPRPTKVPTGGRRRCPACGAEHTRPLGDGAAKKLYADYGLNTPPVILRPRQCESCGHRWEVVPPRFALLTAAAALGLGVPLFLAAAAYFAWQAAGGRDPVQSAVSAVVLLAAAAGCGRGAWYFYLKLRAAPAAGGPPE